MSQLTELETQMLSVFWNESIEMCGQCCEEENISYCNVYDIQNVMGGGLTKLGGVMSSLTQKGFIVDQQESARGAVVNDFTITEEGMAALKERLHIINDHDEAVYIESKDDYWHWAKNKVVDLDGTQYSWSAYYNLPVATMRAAKAVKVLDSIADDRVEYIKGRTEGEFQVISFKC